MYPNSDYHEALRHFQEARQQAALQEVMARLTGRSNELLSYEEVARKLKLHESLERGVQEIPLDAIVGSVGRYTDFTRTFLPRQDSDRDRWVRVKAAASNPASTGFPPIEVYKVGEVYFVRDGNHRVSVALQEGNTHIEAYVIEVKTKVPLTSDLQADDLILMAEYTDFLEQTRLDVLYPGADLRVTVPGQYARLKEHIDVHRYFMGLDWQREVPYDEAVRHWYCEVYMPLVLAIREQGLLHWFPQRTEADLYLWVADHRATLENELGWLVRPGAAVADLIVKEKPTAEGAVATVGGWRKTRMTDRYTDRLFMDTLVPLSGAPQGWSALEQALLIARREVGQLRGLHVVATEADRESAEALAVQAEFNRRCETAGVPGTLIVEVGEIAARVCARALLTDLVVLNVAHPPDSVLSRLNSGLRTIIWNCARPVLTVMGEPSPFDRALLAYDGSPKAKEALFLATYLAERWKTELILVAVVDGARVTSQALDYPRAYLEWHEVPFEMAEASGPIAGAVLNTAREREANLVIMGGYGGNPVKEMVLGSTVNRVLSDTNCPVFICR